VQSFVQVYSCASQPAPTDFLEHRNPWIPKQPARQELWAWQFG
jgi:hypothetical protein